ncbi:NuoM family protein [Streptomyces sp. NPDC018031]|uniref:NuoM family protein n=1 Tax=Streptomyces sp. NPDC018031 TaxID=3365033 RepID=UPI0037A6F829
MNHTTLQLLLAAVVVLPLLGSVAALFPAPPGLRGRDPDQAVLRHGVTVTGAVLAAAVALAAGFDHDDPARMQAQTDLSWIPALDIRIHLGVDGVSLPLLVLTALLTFLCAVYSYRSMPAGPSPKAFVALLLLLECGTLASFAVLDLMLFFLAFEMVLIPMYFLINRWGGADRERAAWRFILYTLLGSVVMLLGLLLIGLKGGTFDMVALAADNGDRLSHTTQLVAVLAIGIGLAVKAPMWPLHSWLPDAHTAAPTVGSVLLAGVLLKMGTYGFVRIVLPMAPEGAHTFAPYLAAFAVVGIIYGSLACLALARPGAKGDLKRLVAYSSVGHMGFVLLGIATLTPTGVNGALFANIAHGLITGLLFFLVGAVKDRYGTTDLDQLAGRTGAALYGRAPRLGGLIAFGAVASLGLPGLAGFWGEMLAMFGAYEPAAGLSRPAYLTYLALAAFGTFLTAAYLLVVVRRVCMGEPGGRSAAAPIAGLPDGGPAAAAALPDGPSGGGAGGPSGTGPAGATAPSDPVDVRGHEFAAWTPLVALTLVAGLWPAVLLGLSDPAVQQLLAGGN